MLNRSLGEEGANCVIEPAAAKQVKELREAANQRPSAEAPNSRNAVRSNPLRRREATSAQTFHKRASGSFSTLVRFEGGCLVATRGRSFCP
jgi:hypothetical protein